MYSDFVIIFYVSVSFRIEMLCGRVFGFASELVVTLFHFPLRLCAENQQILSISE